MAGSPLEVFGVFRGVLKFGSDVLDWLIFRLPGRVQGGPFNLENIILLGKPSQVLGNSFSLLFLK